MAASERVERALARISFESSARPFDGETPHRGIVVELTSELAIIRSAIMDATARDAEISLLA